MRDFSKLSVVFVVIFVLSAAEKNGNSDDRHKSPRNKNNLTLEARLEIEKSTFHWHPYHRIITRQLSNGTEVEEECFQRPRAIEEFPTLWGTHEQKLHGLFLVHIFIAVYLFIVLAFVCDKYFIPAVEQICEVLKISPDVAASTFMATATTMPEFFANTISTFVADSDMGLSAIIGSMMFNTLGVAACASLFTKKPIQIDWWPITRDSIMFSFNISVLVIMAWDGVVMWYETCVLVALYIGYWVLMFQNSKIMKFVKHVIEDRLLWCQRIKNFDIINQRPFDVEPAATANGHVANGGFHHQKGIITVATSNETYRPYDNYGFEGSNSDISKTDLCDLSGAYTTEEEDYKLWLIPENASRFELCWYFFTWPIRLVLYYTIPHPTRHKQFFVISFIMCIAWIGIVSYIIFWMVVIVGDTFDVPEAVMGLTFLAFGGCMPEAISAVIVARKGSGQMGVSNSLGANSLAVLFSLGVPWFFRTMLSGAWRTGANIRIFSHGIEYTILTLLLAVATLYTSVAVAGYKLRKKVGLVISIGYVILIAFAILVELDVLFEAHDRC